MELPAKIQSLLRADQESFLLCSGKDYNMLLKPHQQKQSLKLFESILDSMGSLSAKAQALKQVITNSIKFFGSDHRIYIKIKDTKVLGFIKVGQKNLFYRDFIGNIKELKPTCVLDFYVHQSCQRSGIGKEIFEKFLREENKTPDKLAYDRPSEKLIGFLKKHYGLVKYVPQNNNYVIFDRFFSKEPIIIPELQQKPSSLNLIQSSSSMGIKQRPKSQILIQKQQESSIKKIEIEQPKRQFQQFQTPLNTKLGLNKTINPNPNPNQEVGGTNKHKNSTSQGFPLSIQISENPSFRTTSNTYGNYYKRK